MVTPEKFYSRQTALKEIGDKGQEKLGNSRVLIVGAGGLGHPVAAYLAAAGVGEIAIVDFDKVEAGNLNRQILFSSEHIGAYKAAVLANTISEQNKFINAYPIVDKLDASNSTEIVNRYRLIIDCSDNLITKYLLHDSAWLLAKDLVQGAVYQYEGQVCVFPFSNTEHKGCWRCLRPAPTAANHTKDCNQAGVLGATVGVIGTIQAWEAIQTLLKDREDHCIHTTVNLLTMDIQNLRWEKQQNCPLCSSRATIKEIDKRLYLKKRKEFEVDTLNPDKYTLVDIREADESNANTPSPTRPAIRMPYSDFDNWSKHLNRQSPYLFFCSKGIRSRQSRRDT